MLWRAQEHEPLSARDWDEEAAGEAIADIVADAEAAERDGFWPVHDLDEWSGDKRLTGLYLGSAGMAWALHRLGSHIDAERVLSIALERYRDSPDFAPDHHPPSLLAGEAGVLLAAAALDSGHYDPARLRELVRANRDHPTRELMWGSPGTMLAARACGFEAEWRDSAETLWDRWDTATHLWTQELYGQTAQYLGPAHGSAGNVHALRGYVAEDALAARLGRVLTRWAARDGDLANWPPVALPPEEVADRVRVQWCHGAPGLVATVGDLMPRELALAGGELTWQAGPLAKGAGLCHGTAGNGYAFMRLHALTGDERWLARARRFAMHAAEQVRAHRQRFGRGRYTLFTGDVGVALYLEACIRGDPAFPILDAV